jgi:hypothetical protein
MNLLTAEIIAGMLVLLSGALWHGLSQRMRTQDERLKAMGLAIQFLVEKSEQKPNTYVMDRLRKALEEN